MDYYVFDANKRCGSICHSLQGKGVRKKISLFWTVCEKCLFDGRKCTLLWERLEEITICHSFYGRDMACIHTVLLSEVEGEVTM